jgi:hypothetical protein
LQRHPTSRKVIPVTTKHELAQLIDDAMQANRWSLREVSERAKAQGHALSQQNISRIRNEPVVNLVAKQARGLAAGLDLPVSLVVAAALRSMGFTPNDQPYITPEESVRRDEHLSARDRRVVTAVLRELRRAEESDGSGDAAPNTPGPDGPAPDNVTSLHRDTPRPPAEKAAARRRPPNRRPSED